MNVCIIASVMPLYLKYKLNTIFATQKHIIKEHSRQAYPLADSGGGGGGGRAAAPLLTIAIFA